MYTLMQTSKKLNIIIDLDGTLGHNIYTNKEKNLKPKLAKDHPDLFSDERKSKEFFNTKPLKNSNHIVNNLFHRFKIIILTGRAKRFRHITAYWLGKNTYLYHQLIMIENDWELYEEYQEFKMKHIAEIDPILVIEDDSELINKIKLKFPQTLTHLITKESDWDISVINNIVGEAILMRNENER